MNKNQFLSKLAAELSKLPKDEIEAAMEFYTEYLDDVGEENQEEAIKGLGGASKVAAQIKSDYAVRQIDNMPEDEININIKSAKKGISAMWWVIAGIFAAPIAAPVTIALVVVLIALLIAIFSTIVAAGAGVLAGGIAGLAVTVLGIVSLFTAPTTAMILIGAGIIVIAMTSMLMVGIVFAMKLIFRQVIKVVHKLNEKRIARKMEKNKRDLKGKGGASNEQ